MTTSESRTAGIVVPPAGRYRLDPRRCGVTFGTRHLFGLAPVRGRFDVADGEILVAERTEDAAAHVRVLAGSCRSGNPARDAAVRSARFLDAAAHPVIAFASERLERAAGGWTLHGLLTVRDVSRPVALRVEAAEAVDGELHVTAVTTVDRYDLGVTAAKGLAARHLELRLTVVAERD